MDKYRVTLTTEERAELEQLVSCGKAAARKLVTPASCCSPTIPAETSASMTRSSPRWGSARGPSRVSASNWSPRASTPPCSPTPTPWPDKIKGDIEQRLIELACSQPPKGLRLDPATAGRRAGRPGPGRSDRHRDGPAGAEKKNDIKPWIVETWCIPPRPTPSTSMEDVIRRPTNCRTTLASIRWSASTRRASNSSVRCGSRGDHAAAIRLRWMTSTEPQGGLSSVADVPAGRGAPAARPRQWPCGAPARTTPDASASWWTATSPRGAEDPAGAGQPEHARWSQPVRGVPARGRRGGSWTRSSSTTRPSTAVGRTRPRPRSAS